MDDQLFLKLVYPKTVDKREFKQVQLYIMDCSNKGQKINDIIDHSKYSLLINDLSKKNLQRESNQIKLIFDKATDSQCNEEDKFRKNKCIKFKCIPKEKRTKNILQQKSS